MNSRDNLMARIRSAVGELGAGDDFEPVIKWDSYHEGRQLISRIRGVQKELRGIRRDATASMGSVRSEFVTARANVGSGLGAGLASAFLGKKAATVINKVHRASLKDEQSNAVEQFREVQRLVDQLLNRLESIKMQIEFSPEFKNRDAPKQSGSSTGASDLTPQDSEPDFAKCDCTGCGNTLEFERQHSGTTIFCPVCGVQVELIATNI